MNHSEHDQFRTTASVYRNSVGNRRIWESLERYGGPLLIVHGGEERTRDHAEVLARRHGARLSFVSGTDHQGLGDAWDAVTTPVREFAGTLGE